MPGYVTFLRVVHEAPALRSRVWGIGQKAQAHLEEAPREETGAGAGDRMP